jgi:hypothetical protein
VAVWVAGSVGGVFVAGVLADSGNDFSCIARSLVTHENNIRARVARLVPPSRGTVVVERPRVVRLEAERIIKPRKMRVKTVDRQTTLTPVASRLPAGPPADPCSQEAAAEVEAPPDAKRRTCPHCRVHGPHVVTVLERGSAALRCVERRCTLCVKSTSRQEDRP